MDAKIKVEPREVFFYLDKLIRKIKIANFNEYSIKFELLTVLNDLNESPLKANETQAIIEPDQSFTVRLEYKDSKDKDCDSIIILAIYKVVGQDLIDPEPIQEPLHVPFHFRKVHLVGSESERGADLKRPEDMAQSDRPVSSEASKGQTKDAAKEEARESSPNERPTSSDSEPIERYSPKKMKKKNRFKKPSKFYSLFRSNKTKERPLDRLSAETPKRDQSELGLKEAEKSDGHSDSQLSDRNSDAKEDNFTDRLKETVNDSKLGVKRARDNVKDPDLKQIGNQISKQLGRESNDDTNYQDDLSLYDHNQLNSLRYEEDNVRKLARIIFLFTFFNFCYTLFLTFNPLNKLWMELIDSYSLASISDRCLTWPELGQFFKNITCFKGRK